MLKTSSGSGLPPDVDPALIGRAYACSKCAVYGPNMNRTYGITEVVGTSNEGIDEAIRNAVSRTSKTVRHIDWFEVSQVRGYVRDGEVDHFQVSLKVGYRLEDQSGI